MFSIADKILKDMLTVMTSPVHVMTSPVHSSSSYRNI
jgi:hypothetical protein